MKKIIFFLLLHTVTYSQNAFHNFGDVQIHNDGRVGFHTHLVNDGVSDNNSGITGFFSTTETLTVSGSNRAIFNDVEIDVLNNLELFTSMGVSSDLLFLDGKVITPRNDLGVSLDFINHDVYAGEDDLRHVDGYTTLRGNEEFIFPIGDDNRLRPMIIPSQNQTNFYQGAYFFEDPNTPSTFASSFTTSDKLLEINNVSTYEFWDFNGTTETNITLTWDALSNINLISPNINSLIIVGWNIERDRWENLGNINRTGDFNSGTISSVSFIPNNYEIITLGSLDNDISNNFYISPNGDNIGDNLVFEELAEYPLSKLVIFNRWGNIVFSADNYQNDFEGISNGRATILEKRALPVGTYFYHLTFGKNELSEEKNGWVFISR